MPDNTNLTELDAHVSAGRLGSVRSIYEQIPAQRKSETVKTIAKQAALNGQTEVLEWCFANGFTTPASSVNDDFYQAACSGQSTAVFQVLLNHGFDLNRHESEYIGDALVLAARKGNAEFAEWLLDHGQDPNARRMEYHVGFVAIVYAIAGQNPRLEIVNAIITRNADLKGIGAAIAAAEVGNIEALRRCLEYGVDIEEVARWGIRVEVSSRGTALYRACRHGQTEAARILLDNGANGRARDHSGVSCLQVARERNHADVVELLLSHGISE